LCDTSSGEQSAIQLRRFECIIRLVTHDCPVIILTRYLSLDTVVDIGIVQYHWSTMLYTVPVPFTKRIQTVISISVRASLAKWTRSDWKMEYESNDEVRNYVRCLPVLAFVPPDDVEEAFELLAELQPTTIDHLDELTSFFEHTYIHLPLHHTYTYIRGRSAPERSVSSGHRGSKSSVGEEVSGTEQPCDSSRRSIWSRWRTDLSAFHSVLVTCMNRSCLLSIIDCICAMCFYSN